VAWARAMGHTDAANLLQQNLDEEEAADEKLTSLAEGGINQVAAEAAHPEEDDSEEGAGARKPAARGKAMAAPGRSARR
jgi:Domain of unknown function (DUF892)